jgi:hypothetical protein
MIENEMLSEFWTFWKKAEVHWKSWKWNDGIEFHTLDIRILDTAPSGKMICVQKIVCNQA